LSKGGLSEGARGRDVALLKELNKLFPLLAVVFEYEGLNLREICEERLPQDSVGPLKLLH